MSDRHPELPTSHPDGECYTLPNGECIGNGCVHDQPDNVVLSESAEQPKFAPHGRYTFDPELFHYCTPKQWEAWEALRDHETVYAAAKALGIDQGSLRARLDGSLKKAAQKHYAPEHGINRPLPAGLTSRGVSQLVDAETGLERTWYKSKAEGDRREDGVYVPDQRIITRTATHVGPDGRLMDQWFTEEKALKDKITLIETVAAALGSALPRWQPDAIAPVLLNPDLLVSYPVGDHHTGMLSWEHETGENYDMKIAERLLMKTNDFLFASTPKSAQCLIAILGDFLHYDSFVAETPTSRNKLDADSRFPKMVRAAIRMLRYMIESALLKHEIVNVIIEIGNHDLSSSIWMMEMLANIYENESRVKIDVSPMHYHYFEFGKNLIMTHHGHGTGVKKRINSLPLIMATDKPEAWGRTIYRYVWTGHIHTDTQTDHNGCRVESFRVSAPEDAWAHQKGYRAMRDQKAIILHNEYGEASRVIANPRMFGNLED